MDYNPYELYSDDKDSPKVTKLISAAIDESSSQNEAWDKIKPIIESYDYTGADDTASREAIWMAVEKRFKS